MLSERLCVIHSQICTHTLALAESTQRESHSQRISGSSQPSERERDPASAGRFSNLGILRGVKGEMLPALTLCPHYFGLGLTASLCSIAVGRTNGANLTTKY